MRPLLFAMAFVLLGACAASVPGGGQSAGLVFLTREDCANSARMRANLDEALRRMGLGPDYRVIDVATLADDDPRRGYPTPTILYTNRDLFGIPEPRPPLPEPA
jgi:hypothetical protein